MATVPMSAYHDDTDDNSHFAMADAFESYSDDYNDSPFDDDSGTDSFDDGGSSDGGGTDD